VYHLGVDIYIEFPWNIYSRATFAFRNSCRNLLPHFLGLVDSQSCFSPFTRRLTHKGEVVRNIFDLNNQFELLLIIFMTRRCNYEHDDNESFNSAYPIAAHQCRNYASRGRGLPSQLALATSGFATAYEGA
jgi:hypothetical protein